MDGGSWDRKTGCPTHYFSLCVVRNPKSKQWLAVEETRNRGWWLPGGFVENGDDHRSTALKETKEEAGMDVVLKGILRIENSIGKSGARQRVIFYAEPIDPKQAPKSVADDESKSARWMTLAELKQLSLVPPPEGLRGDELLRWASYITSGMGRGRTASMIFNAFVEGGKIYPLELLSKESEQIPIK